MDRQIASVESYLENLRFPRHQGPPVLFFNASTRIHRVSLNAAFSLLASWGLRSEGIPVRYLVCWEGMVQCILGTRPGKPATAPPCRRCLGVSQRIFPAELISPIVLDRTLTARTQVELSNLSLDELMAFEYLGTPLGKLVLPGLRWVLRRHHLKDEHATLAIYRQYLSSAVSLLHQFDQKLSHDQPQAVVLFNGIFYPEAILRQVAVQRDIPVITHEVGLQPFSAFFSGKEATFREVEVGSMSDLSASQDAQLDEYLGRRFQGQFSMAGIKFWNDLGNLPDHLSRKMKRFRSVVSIFTNVIFDTSQIHANTLFENMFDWLNQMLEYFDRYPEVLFMIRAHPDENRPGKASAESVFAWVDEHGIDHRENVIFIGPEQSFSSYELIDQSSLVLVYNSSIGLEASILGKPVLCAGKARYTQADTVFFPGHTAAYWTELERLLSTELIQVPDRFHSNARKFLFHELFHASLDLSAFLESDPSLKGMVILKAFEPEAIRESPSIDAIVNGIIRGDEFLIP